MSRPLLTPEGHVYCNYGLAGKPLPPCTGCWAVLVLRMNHCIIKRAPTGIPAATDGRAWTRVPFRLACTATPVPNDLRGEFGTHAEFTRHEGTTQEMPRWGRHDEVMGASRRIRIKRPCSRGVLGADVAWRHGPRWTGAVRPDMRTTDSCSLERAERLVPRSSATPPNGSLFVHRRRLDRLMDRRRCSPGLHRLPGEGRRHLVRRDR